MVNFLDFEGTDPASAANEAAEAITLARAEVENRGITAFLFQASNAEEFDQRAEFSGVPEALGDVADKYLGSPDQRAKLTAALRREFVAEKETVHLDSGDVKIEKGKLTRDVGGKPSEHMDKVRELAENGNKGAQFYLNVLSKQASQEFAVCPTCRGNGTHVNPSIDSHGLTADDFAEDPDFEEDYKSGVYDVRCAECGGNRVVPKCSADDCDRPAEAKEHGYGDRRDRVSESHYPTCYEHMDEDDKEDRDSVAEMYAEMAAEQRMGA